MEYVEKISVFIDEGNDNPADKINKTKTIKTSELQNSLLSLLTDAKAVKRKPVEKKDELYFGEYKEKPKAKKEVVPKEEKPKKKKKKKKASVLDELDIDVIYGGSFMDEKEEEEEVEKNEDRLIDADSIFLYYDNDDEIDGIIYDQKKSYKKNKKSDNAFKKEFAEELALLYSLLDETNSFGMDLDKIYKAMTTSKTRGFSKYTSDIIASILSTKQTKLSVLKEITSVKKTIADLAIKESKNNKDSGDDANNSATLAANYLNNIIKTGRQNVVSALMDGGNYYDTDNNDIADFVNNDVYDEDDENINQELIQDLYDSPDSYRSEDADAFIRNEARDVKIQIKKDISSGDWEFIAIDKHNNLVDDYPLPGRKEVEPMSFTVDGSFATDRFGRSYKVIDVI